MKVLIYSTKELYDNSSFEGRAEADVIAYRDGFMHVVLKNKTPQYMPDRMPCFMMGRILEWAERDIFNLEVAALKP
jgi:hypothetical protein